MVLIYFVTNDGFWSLQEGGSSRGGQNLYARKKMFFFLITGGLTNSKINIFLFVIIIIVIIFIFVNTVMIS